MLVDILAWRLVILFKGNFKLLVACLQTKRLGLGLQDPYMDYEDNLPMGRTSDTQVRVGLHGSCVLFARNPNSEMKLSFTR